MLTHFGSIVLISDQCYTWSDEYTKRTSCRIAQTPQRSGAPLAAAAIDPARFADRALQAMRQAGMQMRRRARTWPQVLPVGEFSWATAADGLRTAGGVSAGGRVCRQLSTGARDSGRDLRHQPRAAAQARGAVEEHHERLGGRVVRFFGCESGWRASGQHAGQLARRVPEAFALRGGRR